MTCTEATDIGIVLRWAMGQGDPLGTPYPAEQVTASARRLAAAAHKTLTAEGYIGALRPEEVEL